MSAAWHTLDEAFPDRFLLGLGVSHQPMVEGMRGHDYGPPVTNMRAYLDGIDAAPYFGATREGAERVLAALGPKMLALAAERANGAHPYFVPPEHTEFARGVLGEAPWLCPEQKVVFETDPEVARFLARRAMQIYLSLPNYTNNLLRLGYTDDDIANGGSDRLVDAIVAWGDEHAIRTRIDAHLDAGADHVAVQVVPHDPAAMPLAEWRRLAALLFE
jgi:probable F420-dependent oxidoreductase